ncbi:DEAD/DEAH box helicase [Thermasporomyces composti]|uniref:Superfamily II DNA/RNA helicase n=1 Tax=Thermasporomyces composti TaxID=696763 RepID=A0A3D9V2E2_THECX|nr:DEAD/DEAH box helicase [Thermasporomyces composti]REF35536.1 superfamily II DNA/RNA helicase [Thermasporomyces composti]
MSKGREALTTFKDLGALPDIVEALERVGISEPFPIQEMAIPIALTGSDLIAQARTGTGKTLAFGIPLLQRIVGPRDRDYAHLDAPGKPQALVVVPTRELAIQVADDLTAAAALLGTRIITVYGGVAYEAQLEALAKGVDVVVGTPGRLLDLADRGALTLSHVKVLVLDEADRMLDLGFLPDIERLIELTHELRQTMLFSATMPADIVALARRHMRHPVNVRAEAAGESEVVPATAQFVYRCHELDKPEVLARVLQAENRGKVMVFCTTKRAAQRVADDLAERGFAATAIHGDMGQVARERALDAFRQGEVDVLVATDVAARGIDVEGVTHVVNYTCPDDEKTYLHRIGRTGRAGAAGIAVAFIDWPDVPKWKAINAALQLPFDEPVETYSTSEHLYHDLGIPKDAGGRVGEPRSSQITATGRSRRRSRRGREDDRRGRREERGRRSRQGTETRDGEERTERRTRRRRRRRLRRGVPVEEGTPTTDAPARTDAASSAEAVESTDATEGAEAVSSDAQPADASNPGAQRSTRRRRRIRRWRGVIRGEATTSGPGEQDTSST